ncbi:hypothetical protein [Lampropedia aestuarii]|uniref:hypothetical protein n=1 Tax=Lampropedia aestuarii TaxID=2562762 RepID=UPI001F0F1167|nr:hypothetical protein [Lampropedia aestuarii]
MTDKAKQTPDWERIELDYRAGVKTLRQIAEENGVSHPAITKRAKRDGWSRDLSVKIQAKADELVTKSMVTKAVTVETKIAERELVEANALTIANVRLAHRRDIHRARRLTNALLDELEQETDPETLQALRGLGEMLRNPDERGNDKLNDIYQAIISLPERSKTMKVLAESLQKLVDMERTAFSMDAITGGDVQGLAQATRALLGKVVGAGGVSMADGEAD